MILVFEDIERGSPFLAFCTSHPSVVILIFFVEEFSSSNEFASPQIQDWLRSISSLPNVSVDEYFDHNDDDSAVEIASRFVDEKCILFFHVLRFVNFTSPTHPWMEIAKKYDFLEYKGTPLWGERIFIRIQT